MRPLIFSPSCQPTIMLLNLLILLASACIKTVPADNFRSSGRIVENVISDSSKSDTKLEQTQKEYSSSTTPSTTTVPSKHNELKTQDDYTNHLNDFRRTFAAKTFKTGQPLDLSTTTTKPAEEVKKPHEEYRERAKTFELKINNGTVEIGSESTHNSTSENETTNIKHKDDNNEIKVSDTDLFEALQVKQTDICASCPPLWMNNNTEMKDLCSNYESVSNFFSMTMDKGDAKKIEDKNDLKECTRTITCQHPHMLVKWHDSDLCDVHAPMTGSQSVESTNSFVYKCNGTHWTMHGFPIKSTICALNTH